MINSLTNRHVKMKVLFEGENFKRGPGRVDIQESVKNMQIEINYFNVDTGL